MTEDASSDDLLTPAEVADWFGLNKRWLHIAREKTLGPKFIRLGLHAIRYRRKDVETWLRGRTYQRNSDFKNKKQTARATEFSDR
jgi:predicted DNA-binding transcriptional regulator AlpA